MSERKTLGDSEKLLIAADELEKILKVVPYIVFQNDCTPDDLRRIAARLEELDEQWDCTCGYMNSGPVCTKCYKLRARQP